MVLKKIFSQPRHEIFLILILFSLALGLRLIYQKESIVDHPIRADAAKYFTAAFNLYSYGVYSLERPGMDFTPPETRTNLSPGYPLFLTLFMREDALLTADNILSNVLKAQAVLGALTTVLTFFLARLALGTTWGYLAGILTAFSPHLIAMDGYLLTESLFTFVMMFGTLILAIAWKDQRYTMTFIAGIILTFSAYIRFINSLFLFFLAFVFLFHPGERSFSPRPTLIRHIVSMFMGFAIVTGAYYGFINLAVKNKNVYLGTEENKTALSEKPEKFENMYPVDEIYNDVGAFLTDSLRPPQFYVAGESHIAINHPNREYKELIKGNFWDDPLSYIKWNLIGKLYISWHWDDSYNGDVYIYPMLIPGFEVNPLLKSVHRSMYFIHWPLYLLSLTGLLVLFVRWQRKALDKRLRVLLVPALGFAYFLILLSFTNIWINRYTIPVRPFSYILASASLSWLFLRTQSYLLRYYKEKNER